MNFIQVKPFALILLVTTITNAQGADLGNMEINSGIDQRLSADIPLNLTPNEQFTGTRVKVLSSQTDNRSDRQAPEIEISTDDNKLKLSSKQAIHAQHLDLVLEVETDKETQYKQFSIDLSRASEDFPLIVSPKNNLDKIPAPTLPNKKNYEKKPQLPLTTLANSPTADALKVKNPKPKDRRINSSQITVSQPVPAAVTAIASAPTAEATPNQIAESQATQTQAITTANNTTPTTVSPPPAQPDWIEENSFMIIAFLAGILGVLILQRLLTPKSATAKAKSDRFNRDDQYQIAQNSLEPEVAEHNDPNIASDVALFEELLRTRMQQLSEANPQASVVSNQASAVELNDSTQDDEFAFDFDLPDFSSPVTKNQ